MFSRFKYTEYPKEVRKNLIARDKAKKQKKRTKKKSRIVLVVLLAILLAVAAALLLLMKKSRDSIHTDNDIVIETGNIGIADGTAPVIYNSGRQIVYKGQTYTYNENIVSAAFLGIDRENLGTDSGIIGTGGQADTIAVALYDTSNGKVRFIVIPRDTMVDVNNYDIAGGYLDIKKEQICMAYAYGDGKKTSCENTLRSINRLLMGIPVDYYIAMDLNGIPALNDAIGGVTLTCIETEGRFTQGETITLTGSDADAYVRDRDMSKLDSDTPRRARQKQYAECFIEKASGQIKKNFSLVAKLYSLAMKYVVTDLSLDKTTYIASTAVKNGITVEDFKTVPGEYTAGEKYAEYNADETALFEIILDLFYVKQN